MREGRTSEGSWTRSRGFESARLKFDKYIGFDLDFISRVAAAISSYGIVMLPFSESPELRGRVGLKDKNVEVDVRRDPCLSIHSAKIKHPSLKNTPIFRFRYSDHGLGKIIIQRTLHQNL
jgi:hypothetical protein